MNKEIYKYSIIVPAYNVENYLERCINSVTEQKYNNYEIIIVDDGSTDQTGDICDNIAKKNDKIKIIHKSNGGLSSARNEGIKAASGDYFIFLDSDDFWVENNFLANINTITDNEDLIIFNSFKYFNENSKIKARFMLPNNFNNLNHNEKMNYIIENNIYKACAWDKIIKASILKDNDILFPEGVLSEDMEWCGMVLDKVRKISVYPNIVYAYRQRNNSISKSVSKKHLIDIYNQIYEGMKSKNQYVLNYFAFEYLILYSYAFILKDKEIIKNTKKLTWILSYDISHKVKKIKKIYNILGYTLCGKILGKYLKWK